MSIATKRGDAGVTSLLFGRRVPKTHPRVVAYGGVDELGSSLGLCRAHSADDTTKALLREVQGELIYLMSELATDDGDQARWHEKYGENAITNENVERFTNLIKEKEQHIQFRGWSYPGENPAEAFFDQARTTCRRAERGIVELKESGVAVRPELLQYLNRLADLLWLQGREHAE